VPPGPIRGGPQDFEDIVGQWEGQHSGFKAVYTFRPASSGFTLFFAIVEGLLPRRYQYGGDHFRTREGASQLHPPASGLPKEGYDNLHSSNLEKYVTAIVCKFPVFLRKYKF
jgi:hypothetical protein